MVALEGQSILNRMDFQNVVSASNIRGININCEICKMRAIAIDKLNIRDGNSKTMQISNPVVTL